MAPLIFLLATFVILYLVNKYVLKDRLSISFIGRAAMAAMLIVTGVSHFTNTESMIEMMPDAMPAKRETVYLTGICELLAVIGLIWTKFSRITAILLIIFFVAVLPANIIGSFREVAIGGMDYGPWYLLFRVPLQIFFIWWVWYFGLRTGGRASGLPETVG